MDPKVPIVAQFLARHLAPPRLHPTIIGLSGPQGCGKTTFVQSLAAALRTAGHTVAVMSIDDLYLTHADQCALAAEHPDNKLLRHRGVPGTHDLALGAVVFDALRAGEGLVKLPSYDKSAHMGKGDRVPEEQWDFAAYDTDVVLFEGWCVGFRSFEKGVVGKIWGESPQWGVLKRHRVQELIWVNEALREYDNLTDRLDVLIHIDAADIGYVYDWRLQQEECLRAAKGSGMTDDQVIEFIDGYMPAYELYVPVLREGLFGHPGRQLRIMIDKKREVVEVVEL